MNETRDDRPRPQFDPRDLLAAVVVSACVFAVLGPHKSLFACAVMTGGISCRRLLGMSKLGGVVGGTAVAVAFTFGVAVIWSTVSIAPSDFYALVWFGVLLGGFVDLLHTLKSDSTP